MEAHTALWSAATFVFLPSLSRAKPVFINRVFKPSWPQDRKNRKFSVILEIISVREELNTGHLWGRLWPIVSL